MNKDELARLGAKKEYAYIVGRHETGKRLAGFQTLSQAEKYIAGTLYGADPEGVERGDYYIDGPCDAKAADAPGSPGRDGIFA